MCRATQHDNSMAAISQVNPANRTQLLDVHDTNKVQLQKKDVSCDAATNDPAELLSYCLDVQQHCVNGNALG